MFICVISVICVLNSCTNPPKIASLDLPPIDTLTVECAGGFRVEYFDDYKRVTVLNPWKKGENLARYYLVKNAETQTPADGLKIKIPLQRLAITSCTHIEFINLIGELQSIKGVCSPQLIYNDELRKQIAQEKTVDLGDAFNINLERCFILKPDAVMLSAYNNRNETDDRLKKASIPVIYNNEWQENDLLGRAEWLKFVAVFFDKEQQADSIFSEIKSRYNHILALVSEQTSTEKRSAVLPGVNFKGTWYMPGGRSYMSRLYADAGADYFFKNDTLTGSLPLSFEAVVQHFRNADVWFGCDASSISELLQSDSRYEMLDAVKNARVFSFNARATASGANDFWESALAHPDMLLTDVVSVLYPNVLSEHKLVYIEKIEK
ncbi:MAG: ABC transporter substrate-binding protein [Prevotellaceae bacterium]|nr:ABC transporter substrate-binding protein [Prevotellaceae bacterium]